VDVKHEVWIALGWDTRCLGGKLVGMFAGLPWEVFWLLLESFWLHLEVHWVALRGFLVALRGSLVEFGGLLVALRG